MNAIIFGATGMVGQGVLRECLLDPEILHVLSIVPSAISIASRTWARKRGHQQALRAGHCARVHDSLPSSHDSLVQFMTRRTQNEILGVFC